MSRRVRANRATYAVAAAVLSVLLGACGGMPTSGPITEVDTDRTFNADPGIYFDPQPPRDDESPLEIVDHFLEAMKATPVNTGVARKFLSARAQRTWTPERATMTYSDLGAPVGITDMSISMEGVAEYDHRGVWKDNRAHEELELGLIEEDGQWRIDRLPDALIVSDGWFDNIFQRQSLYYFDPSGEILVPEPAFVPEGDQQPSALVNGLLFDPAADPRLIRNYLPPDLEAGLSVPVSPGGIADVSLLGSPEAIDEVTRQRILTQLVWTMRQQERIRALQLTIGDQPIGLPGGSAQVDLDLGRSFDPIGASSSPDLFGIVDGRIVRGELGSMRATTGPMGSRRLGIRSIGVALAGERVAAVSGGGSALLVAPVEGRGSARQVLSGAGDLLPPMWDFKDRLWLIDRNAGAARVLLVNGARTRTVTVPGITGRDVTHALVSRDGSRLVGVVRSEQRGAREDRVMAARILHDAKGRVLGATPALRLDVGSGASGGVIGDIGWRSPTSVSVSLDTDDLTQISTVSVDGAPGELAVTGATLLRGAVPQLATSPDPDLPVLAYRARLAANLAAPQRALSPPPRGTSYLTYVG